MTLTKCKECEKEISKKAKLCPSCGAPQGSGQYTLVRLTLVLIFGWFIYNIFSEEFPSVPSPTEDSSIVQPSTGDSSLESEIPVAPVVPVVNRSFGKITVGPIRWRGSGYEYARSIITYENNTSRTFSRISIQCVAKDVTGNSISSFKVHFAVRLGDPSLIPGTIKTKEAVFKSGAQVESVSCQVDRVEP